MFQKLKMVGRITATITKADGSIQVHERNNLIVDGGIDFACDALAKPSSRPAVLSYIAIGEDDTAVDPSDTALGSEAARGSATYAHNTGDDYFTMTSTFAPGTGTGDITEAGMFNDPTAGTMFNRVVFSTIPKEAGDTLDMVFTVTFTPS